MGTIQSDVGLNTGINIKDTVDKLINLQSAPRTRLNAQITAFQTQQQAITSLTAQLLAVQLVAKKFKDISVVGARNVAQGDSKAISVTATNATPVGTYFLTPIQTAQAEQQLSGGLAARNAALGAGTFSLRSGSGIAEGVRLDQLNGGLGVAVGKIRLTDRSGGTSIVDLRNALTIDDVVTAINTADGTSIKAEVSGDRLKLVDNSGGSGNLRVQEFNGGKTAADLGLASISIASNSATGQDILKLYSGLDLNRLNDGNGLSLQNAAADLRVTLQDGTSLSLDFHRLGHADRAAVGTTNATNGLNAEVKLTAKTVGGAYDGVRLQFVDTGAVAARGSEVASYNSGTKVLTVDIKSGQSTADDIIASIGANPGSSALFTAARSSGGIGAGVVTLIDTATTTGGVAVTARNEKTLGELLTTINEADPTKLRAAFNSTGDRIVLTDLTSGGSTFAVANLNGGTVAEDLGLTGAAAGNLITSGRLQGGLRSPLLRSLNGGRGLGTLGQIQVTDRSGAAAIVDLSGSETLDDVLASINGAGIGVTAGYNGAKNGLQLTDTTGLTTSNLIVVNSDGTNTATKLGITANGANETISGSTLSKQNVSENTLLSSYNAGKGVTLGSFVVTNSNGQQGAVNLVTLGAKTIGDVITAINGLSLNVLAKVNDTGDGIALVDSAAGTGKLAVREVGTGTTASSLHILGQATAGTISGSSNFQIALTGTETLDDLVTKINGLNAGVTASVFVDPDGNAPFHLSLQSNTTGKSGRLIVDGGAFGLAFDTLTKGQDAVLRYGAASSSRLLTSATNSFQGVAAGLNVSINSIAADPVTVQVTESSDSASKAVQSFVDQYNKVRETLSKLTSFDSTSQTGGTLFGSREALRVDSTLTTLLSSRIVNASGVKGLSELGVSIGDSGKLNFDSSKFADRFAKDPSGVKKFFTDETLGFGKKASDALEALVGEKNSVLVTRVGTLQKLVDDANKRVDIYTTKLNTERDRLTLQYYNLDIAIGKIKASAVAITTLSTTTTTK